MTSQSAQNQRASLATSLLGVVALFAAGPGCSATPHEDDSIELITSELDMTKFRGWTPVPTAGAPAGLFTSGPAAATRGAFSVDLFARGTDNALWMNFGFSLNNGASWSWNGWTSLGGALLDQGQATTWGSAGDRLAVVARGTTNQAYIRTWVQGSSFTPWSQVSNGALIHAPAVTYVHPHLFVVGTGTDNTLYFTKNDVSGGFNPANWTGWAQIPGGSLTSEPSVTSAFSTIFVSARGTGHKFHLIKSSDGGSTWTPWSEIPGEIHFSSGPALVISPNGQLNVFGTATRNDRMWNSTSNDSGATWSTFLSTPGALRSAPAADSFASGSIHTFGKQSDNNIHWNWYKE